MESLITNWVCFVNQTDSILGKPDYSRRGLDSRTQTHKFLPFASISYLLVMFSTVCFPEFARGPPIRRNASYKRRRIQWLLPLDIKDLISVITFEFSAKQFA
jgi:hypothetical protein